MRKNLKNALTLKAMIKHIILLVVKLSIAV